MHYRPGFLPSYSVRNFTLVNDLRQPDGSLFHITVYLNFGKQNAGKKDIFTRDCVVILSGEN